MVNQIKYFVLPDDEPSLNKLLKDGMNIVIQKHVFPNKDGTVTVVVDYESYRDDE